MYICIVLGYHMIMDILSNEHLFHIPVMGTAFTIDTPLKVAQFGISSVISLCDDELCEEMRQHYAQLFQKEYVAIDSKEDDFRARRISAYLNLIDECVNEQIQRIKQESFETGTDIHKYFELLPDTSSVKVLYETMLKTENAEQKETLQLLLKDHIKPGSIDVNIMTKLDKDVFDKERNPIPLQSDALAALRGFAESTLDASIIFSAGFNRRLYAYLDTFNDFFPDESGYIKKRIVLKVTDYRSSLTQGKFLAKKGLWVSEYRIESGLNCGGHAFASDGYLMGPILEEFKQSKKELVSTLFVTCNDVLQKQNRIMFSQIPAVDITVQGGIGTYNENKFLLDFYNLKRTGWATPFLLVPEVTTLDDETRMLLSKSTQKDLYLSGISPLGVPFNAVKGTASDQQREERITANKPGSPCPKGFLKIHNKEFSKVPVCTASIFFQKRKIEQLKSLNLGAGALKQAVQKVLAKTCLCEDLAAGALLKNNIENKRSLKTAVCPGPNLAYFSSITSLKDMVSHIYGRINLLSTVKRSHMFINELRMYIDYFKKEVTSLSETPSSMDLKYVDRFRSNLMDGIAYYQDLVPKLVHETKKYRDTMSDELSHLTNDLNNIINQHARYFLVQSA